jgi:hypothetical protein
MVINFWMDKFRQDKINTLYQDIAKYFKMTSSNFLQLSKTKQYELLHQYLKDQEKKVKKSKKQGEDHCLKNATKIPYWTTQSV